MRLFAAVFALSLTPLVAHAEEPAAPATASELAQQARTTWDLLGVELDATWGHTLVYAGPRYQILTRPGLYVDATAGAGVTLRDGKTDNGGEAPTVFGQAEGYVGWALFKGLKNKDTLFNLYEQSSSDATTTTTTYSFLETQVVAQRNFVVYVGPRAMIGRGPAQGDETVAPGYLALAAGVGVITTWREVQEKGGVKRMVRGVEGFDLTLLYTPQSSEVDGFSNFEHFGGELRWTRTTELGRIAAPFHLAVGIQPGLGLALRFGMMFPVMSPAAGPREAKTGELAR